MGVREAKVEKYLDQEIKQLGGLTRKWVSPQNNGCPDRIVIVRGNVWFVEVKTEDGKLAPVQIREHKRLEAVGAEVRTVYGHQGVREFIEEVLSC